MSSGTGAATRFSGRPLSITETAAAAGTTVRALRHYEDRGLLRPLRSAGGSRLYPPALVDTACCIADLRRLGVATVDIGLALQCLEQRRTNDVVLMLQRRREEIEAQTSVLDALLERFGGEVRRIA